MRRLLFVVPVDVVLELLGPTRGPTNRSHRS
jgi:hypothetical protein